MREVPLSPQLQLFNMDPYTGALISPYRRLRDVFFLRSHYTPSPIQAKLLIRPTSEKCSVPCDFDAGRMRHDNRARFLHSNADYVCTVKETRDRRNFLNERFNSKK